MGAVADHTHTRVRDGEDWKEEAWRDGRFRTEYDDICAGLARCVSFLFLFREDKVTYLPR